MSFFEILQAFLPLLLIVGLLFILMKYVKKSGFSFKPKTSKFFNIKVINTQMIMPKKFISVVKVKDTFFVLGISDNSVNLLKEYEGMEDIEEIPVEQANGNRFIDHFKKSLGIK
jgi:flagellar biosynthetic protein FliO